MPEREFSANFGLGLVPQVHLGCAHWQPRPFSLFHARSRFSEKSNSLLVRKCSTVCYSKKLNAVLSVDCVCGGEGQVLSHGKIPATLHPTPANSTQSGNESTSTLSAVASGSYRRGILTDWPVVANAPAPASSQRSLLTASLLRCLIDVTDAE